MSEKITISIFHPSWKIHPLSCLSSQSQISCHKYSCIDTIHNLASLFIIIIIILCQANAGPKLFCF